MYQRTIVWKLPVSIKNGKHVCYSLVNCSILLSDCAQLVACPQEVKNKMANKEFFWGWCVSGSAFSFDQVCELHKYRQVLWAKKKFVATKGLMFAGFVHIWFIVHSPKLFEHLSSVLSLCSFENISCGKKEDIFQNF